MNKIIVKDFRPTKEFTLPQSGVTLTCYPSILVGDMTGLTVKDNDLENNLTIISKVIKSWNLFEKESDESPLAITPENIKRLPSTDFEWFMEELKKFSNEQKKSSEISAS